MRQITLKYAGACRHCQLVLDVGKEAMYERDAGIFCIGHQPPEIKKTRRSRPSKTNQNSEQKVRVAPPLSPLLEIGHEIDFITQPTHMSFQEQANQAPARSVEYPHVSGRSDARTENLQKAHVDNGQRRRTQTRDITDKAVSPGSRIHDLYFGNGTVISVHRKSYWIRFDNNGLTYARDKSCVSRTKP